MLAEIRGSCKQNREFANIAQKCFQNLANKKSVWSLCKVVQTKKTSHKVRGVLLREGLYKAFASCLSSAAVSGFLSSSSIFAASLSSLSVTAVSAVLGSVSSTGSKGYSQAGLGALVGCSNNHMSHVEVGQTKVSLAMLLKLAFVLEKNFDYFLLDTPYAKCDSIIDNEIAAKLKKCNVTTLITVGKLIDVLIDQQEMIKKGGA